jgi:hypothetical protein
MATKKPLIATDVALVNGGLPVSAAGLAAAAEPGKKMSVVSTAGGTTILAANANRVAAIITNLNTTRMLSLSLGGTPVSGAGIPLAPAADATHPGGTAIIQGYTGAISGIMSGSGSSNDVAVTEI